MFDDVQLLGIAKSIGKPVKVDTSSVAGINGRYARVCVELNLEGKLAPNVLVWGHKQPVEYEGLHKICFKCGRHGHKKEHCEPLREDGDPAAPSTSTSTRPFVDQATPDNPFGPWMLPAYERQRQQLAHARMTRRSTPSAATQQMNRKLDNNRASTRNSDPVVDGSQPF